jgi:hypothetical protein
MQYEWSVRPDTTFLAVAEAHSHVGSHSFSRNGGTEGSCRQAI